jgi:hypothetical protein
MPGPGHSHSDLPLSDTLSARSYLEFGRDEFQAQLQLQSRPIEDNPASVSNPPVSRDPIEASGKSGPHLRPRLWPRERQPIHKDSEKTEAPAPGIKDPLGDKDRPVRKRGRPRIETAKDAAAIEVCNHPVPQFQGRGS